MQPPPQLPPPHLSQPPPNCRRRLRIISVSGTTSFISVLRYMHIYSTCWLGLSLRKHHHYHHIHKCVSRRPHKHFLGHHCSDGTTYTKWEGTELKSCSGPVQRLNCRCTPDQRKTTHSLFISTRFHSPPTPSSSPQYCMKTNNMWVPSSFRNKTS